MARYSRLSPLSVEEQATICKLVVRFFHPLESDYIKAKIQQGQKSITPPSVMDLLEYYKQQGIDLWSKLNHVQALISKLVLSNILNSSGGNDHRQRLLCMIELSERQRRGWLWLGRALGSPYIASEIGKDIAFISGPTKTTGDLAVGTGLLISEREILTCGHVIRDLSQISEIRVGGKTVAQERTAVHPHIDIGVIYLRDQVATQLPDLAFRDASTLEEIVIVGYPTVPRSLEPVLTFQSGEICAHIAKTQDAWPVELFSAIARPGNSGGPVVAMDGRVVGIVTRSLERQKEEADFMAPMPFFAAVPSKVIAQAVIELDDGRTILPWESWS